MSMCLKVPRLINPSRTMLLERKDNYTFYEPNQFVLGHGTWLEGWQIYQTNDLLKVRDAGTVGISQVPDTSAGNNMY